MRSICTTKKKRRLMQVEWKRCDIFNKDNFNHEFYTTHNLWEEASLPSPIVCFVFFAGTTSKCHFSLGLPSGSPKTRTFVVQKLWMFISFSNQVYFENARVISYRPEKDLFNGV